MTADDVPPGFARLESSPFVAAAGPLYLDRDGVVGVRVQRAHTNSMGSVHGGFLMTVADVALGRAARRELGADAVVRTVSMTVDFLASSGPGRWLRAEPSLDRIGQRTVFASCRVVDGDILVARATAVLMRG